MRKKTTERELELVLEGKLQKAMQNETGAQESYTLTQYHHYLQSHCRDSLGFFEDVKERMENYPVSSSIHLAKWGPFSGAGYVRLPLVFDLQSFSGVKEPGLQEDDSGEKSFVSLVQHLVLFPGVTGLEVVL